MKNAIIVHGMPTKEEYYNPAYPSPSNFGWIPWLQKQLVVHDIGTATPEMPHAYNPNYSVWKKEFERFDITPETILVGHSCGGGFLIRWLSEQKDTHVGHVYLVAPWLNVGKEFETNFFDFQIDTTLATRIAGLTIFNSTDDDNDILESVTFLRSSLSEVKYVEFRDKGHFVGKEFVQKGLPELLEEILDKNI